MNDPTGQPDSDDTPRVIPTFQCLVYVQSTEGKINARVANLDGLEASGGSEREALAKIIPAFKSRVSELLGNNEEIPWVEPPPDPLPDEQKRFIPVHL